MTLKTRERITYNISRAWSTNKTFKRMFADELDRRGITTYARNDRSVFGVPDFVFKTRKVAVFCDIEFWQRYNLNETNLTINSNTDFRSVKIERTITREAEVTLKLNLENWRVFRFSGRPIENNVSEGVG